MVIVIIIIILSTLIDVKNIKPQIYIIKNVLSTYITYYNLIIATLLSVPNTPKFYKIKSPRKK